MIKHLNKKIFYHLHYNINKKTVINSAISFGRYSQFIFYNKFLENL